MNADLEFDEIQKSAIYTGFNSAAVKTSNNNTQNHATIKKATSQTMVIPSVLTQ